jgi:hypothetical protein
MNKEYTMKKFPGLLVIMFILAANTGRAADNVVLITLDGMRWQEVFRGLDRSLAEHVEFGGESELLMREFWQESQAQRATALLPFLHNTVFKEGSYVGNRDLDSCARVSNPWYFSYPGYSEILTGVVNESINTNGKKQNPERTLHELLNSNSDFRGRSAAFASWDVFPYIFNTHRSGIYVNAFEPLSEPGDQYEKMLNTLYADIPTPWPTVRNDAFTHLYAMSYFRREHPRLLYISYGETDDFAHDGKYDEYILAAHRTDRFIGEIWEMIQSTEGYRDNTVLFITVDHGRGEEPIETWLHHASKRSTTGYMLSLAQYADGIVGSEATWMAAIGPDISSNGLIETGDDCLTSNRIAATLLQVLGEDYQNYNPAMGSPLTEMLK